MISLKVMMDKMVEDNIAKDTRSKLPDVFSAIEIVEDKQKGETVSSYFSALSSTTGLLMKSEMRSPDERT